MSLLRQAIYAAASCPAPLPQGEGWVWHFCFRADSAVFAGHFPHHPVLPAVVQLLMAETALECCGHAVELYRVPQAKFLSPIEPGQHLVLSLARGSRQGLWDCTLHSGQTLAARFQLEGREA